ncbi:annexin-B11-like isoform X2 [Aphelenchoides avenae]|nr:annexin-B11-like isoform X2 [Aphelenchus avenae]
MRGPTVRPAPDFDAFADAKLLHDVIFSLVSGKEEAVASVLCSRSNEQRYEITQRYTETTRHELTVDISAAFSGEFKELMVGLCLPLDEFYATELHRAIKDHRGNVIAEIFGSLSCVQIMAVKQAYHRLFHTTLKEDILSHTSTRKLAVFELLAMIHREESTEVDEKKLKKDLALLHDLSRVKEHESHRHEIFSQMLAIDSYAQLRALFDAYEQSVGSSLEDLIRKAFAGDDNAEALIALARIIHNGLTTFAANLRSYYDKDVKWFGVSNNQHDVIRTVIGRSEVDLGDVLQKYKAMYGSAFLGESNHAFDSNYATALAVLCGIA